MNEQCLKLTAYFGERQRAVGGAGRFLADAMLDLFGSHNVATSVMLRGTTSFGPKHEFRCDQSLSLSEDPPVTVAAVDIESKIRSLVDDVTAMTDRGLVTLERARLVTRHSGAEEFGDIDSRNGDAAKLTIYAGRQVRVAGRRPTTPSASFCIDMDSQVPQCCSASTARHTVGAAGPGSSAATSMFH